MDLDRVGGDGAPHPGYRRRAGRRLDARNRSLPRPVRHAPGLAGGAWFILGPSIRPAWAGGGGMMMMGQSVWSQIAASVGYHYGTGVAVAILAAYALGALAATDRARRSDAPATGGSRERVSTAPSTNDRVSV